MMKNNETPVKKKTETSEKKNEGSNTTLTLKNDPKKEKAKNNDQKKDKAKNKTKIAETNKEIGNNQNVTKKVQNKRKRGKSKPGKAKVDIAKNVETKFVFEDIANNDQASSLIKDLVNCFTCNSTLPKSELDAINTTLYERTISVFLYVLNCCVQKIIRKLSENNSLQTSSNKVSKKNVSCQTTITGDIISHQLSH